MSRLNTFLTALSIALNSSFLMGAANLTVVGDCRFLLDSNTLQSAAGSDFETYIDSSPGCYRIFIQTQSDQDRWRLSMNAQVQGLPPSSTLMVRVSNGNINGNISSSWLDWQQAGNQNVSLVEGQGQAGAVEVQLRLVDIKLKDLTRSQYAPRITFEVEDL